MSIDSAPTPTDAAQDPAHTSRAQDPTPPDVRVDDRAPARPVEEVSIELRVDEAPPRRRIGSSRVMRTNDPEGDQLKASVLTGALPWLKEFHGRVIVVKYGGHRRRRLVDADVGRSGVLGVRVVSGGHVRLGVGCCHVAHVE